MVMKLAPSHFSQFTSNRRQYLANQLQIIENLFLELAN